MSTSSRRVKVKKVSRLGDRFDKLPPPAWQLLDKQKERPVRIVESSLPRSGPFEETSLASDRRTFAISGVQREVERRRTDREYGPVRGQPLRKGHLSAVKAAEPYSVAAVSGELPPRQSSPRRLRRKEKRTVKKHTEETKIAKSEMKPKATVSSLKRATSLTGTGMAVHKSESGIIQESTSTVSTSTTSEQSADGRTLVATTASGISVEEAHSAVSVSISSSAGVRVTHRLPESDAVEVDTRSGVVEIRKGADSRIRGRVHVKEKEVLFKSRSHEEDTGAQLRDTRRRGRGFEARFGEEGFRDRSKGERRDFDRRRHLETKRGMHRESYGRQSDAFRKRIERFGGRRERFEAPKDPSHLDRELDSYFGRDQTQRSTERKSHDLDAELDDYFRQ